MFTGLSLSFIIAQIKIFDGWRISRSCIIPFTGFFISKPNQLSSDFQYLPVWSSTAGQLTWLRCSLTWCCKACRVIYSNFTHFKSPFLSSYALTSLLLHWANWLLLLWPQSLTFFCLPQSSSSNTASERSGFRLEPNDGNKVSHLFSVLVIHHRLE